MDWDNAQLSVQIAGSTGPAVRNGSSGYVVLPSDVRARWVDPTLMATRTFLLTRTPTTIGSNIDDTVFAGIGLIMWTDINDTAPTAADMPDPLRDGDLDWVNRWVFPFLPGTPAGHQGGPNIFDNTHLSKAKRKFGQDMGLLMCFSSQRPNGIADVAIQFAADVRALIKE